MNRLSITYEYNYELGFAPEYKWTICGKCVNAKTGRVIKKVYNSRCLGYNIRGRFHSLTSLRKHLVKPTIIKTPF
jgi:hypothetical protein